MVESIPTSPAVTEAILAPLDQSMVVDHIPLDPALPGVPAPEAAFTEATPAVSPSSSSYVTYTNLTPSFPQGNFDIPVDVPVAGPSNFAPAQGSPTPSLLSELNAEFPFPTSDISLLAPSGGDNYAPTLQDQVDGVPFQVQGGAGPEMTLSMSENQTGENVLPGTLTELELQEWQQKQQEQQDQQNADYVRQQAEMKKARQDQEKVWLPRVKRYYNGL